MNLASQEYTAEKIPQLSTDFRGITVFQTTNWHNCSCKLLEFLGTP